MKYTEEEKAIINENPDFDNQLKILEEEHQENVKKRKFVILNCSIIIGIATLFWVSFATIYVYRPYSSFSNDNCKMVNLKIYDSPIPNLNITDDNTCVPKYNIDYFHNGKPTFNIDLYGDRSTIFNRTNQMDPTNTYCTINCDEDNDGWPDYNIDLNGDGIIDLNIVKDPRKDDHRCNINCDLNKDTLPDTNIDTDGDGKPDVNITKDGTIKPPIFNVDYMNNQKPTFNIIGEDGKIFNPVNDATGGKTCTVNCDLNGDGWPEFNIDIDGDGKNLINELIKIGDEEIDYSKNKEKDWKCFIDHSLEGCNISTKTNNNTYINIDVDGDGKPDVNISKDHGKTITNPINKEVIIDNKPVILNEDVDKDGFPDNNIDIDNDGIPDINIIDPKTNKCIKNCDTNGDGIPDFQNELNEKTKEKTTIREINIDKDYDTICDVNCDLNQDLTPDINVDINGDLIPDINIDYDHDNKPDFNIDTDGDGKPDLNIDAFGVGVCNFNCNGQNPIGKGPTCTKNCDTNDDGLPDKNVDIDNDGKCDINCGDNDTKDENNNFYKDKEESINVALEVSQKESNAVYVNNPLDIKAYDIEPGWNGKYVLVIKNNAATAVRYRIYWTKVKNEFTNINNLDYFINRDNATYIPDSKAPRGEYTLKEDAIIKAQSSFKYVLSIDFKETGISQNIDAGKVFYGQLKIEVLK